MQVGINSAQHWSHVALAESRTSRPRRVSLSNFPKRPATPFVDLFAGIGGFRSALESSGGECVFTSEWDKHAQLTYRANFVLTQPIAGDIRHIRESDIPAHTVLTAGFPCQPFSLAGVSKKNSLGRNHGFLDATQGTLFFDVARIIRSHRPRGFILENVKNLVSHDSGKTFAVIRRVLEDELGYTVHYKVIDARDYLPQHRQRIVMVGLRDGERFSWEDVQKPAAPRSLLDVLHPAGSHDATDTPYLDAATGEVSEKYTLSDNLWRYLQQYAAKHKAAGNGFGYGLVDPQTSTYTRTLSARYHKDGSEILVSRGKGRNPRRLTPRECARLMGYDDSFMIPVSDTQAYRQFGNSIAVPLFREVAATLVGSLYASGVATGDSRSVA
jgi:DNA (cytosine-5)-methyltransferase 1